jgi:uncharacterized protein YjbI with pentapeptide repeats
MARSARPKEIAEPTPPEAPAAAERRTALDATDELVEVEFVDLDLREVDGSHSRMVRCEFRGVQLTAARFRAAVLVDVCFEHCELSGVDFHEASLTRVEFRDCRMTGINFSQAELRHVRWTHCKLDDANLRAATLDHGWAQGCSCVELDAYEARLTALRVDTCDLTRADFSKVLVAGLDLRGSTIEAMRGASGLRNLTIGVDGVVPFALSVFAETGVRVD